MTILTGKCFKELCTLRRSEAFPHWCFSLSLFSNALWWTGNQSRVYPIISLNQCPLDKDPSHPETLQGQLGMDDRWMLLMGPVGLSCCYDCKDTPSNHFHYLMMAPSLFDFPLFLSRSWKSCLRVPHPTQTGHGGGTVLPHKCVVEKATRVAHTPWTKTLVHWGFAHQMLLHMGHLCTLSPHPCSVFLYVCRLLVHYFPHLMLDKPSTLLTLWLSILSHQTACQRFLLPLFPQQLCGLVTTSAVSSSLEELHFLLELSLNQLQIHWDQWESPEKTWFWVTLNSSVRPLNSELTSMYRAV